MVPLPSASTSLIMSWSSASVGFWPKDRMTVPSSLVVMLPVHSHTNHKFTCQKKTPNKKTKIWITERKEKKRKPRAEEVSSYHHHPCRTNWRPPWTRRSAPRSNAQPLRFASFTHTDTYNLPRTTKVHSLKLALSSLHLLSPLLTSHTLEPQNKTQKSVTNLGSSSEKFRSYTLLLTRTTVGLNSTQILSLSLSHRLNA